MNRVAEGQRTLRGAVERLPDTPRPLVKSGVFEGYDQRDIEALGVNLNKRWVGSAPQAAPVGKSDTLGRGIGVAIARWALSLRYDVDVRLMTPGLDSSMQGVMAMVMPHTAVADPAITYTSLWKFLHLMPLATESLFTKPFLKRLLSGIGGRRVPDTTNPIGTGDEMAAMIGGVTTGLRAGNSFGFHPAGELLREANESIGASALMHKILELRPETPVIAVVPTNINGSRLSWAGNGGNPPSLSVGSLIGDAIHNILRFRAPFPKRPVTLEVYNITEKLKELGTLKAQNAWLEETFSNRVDPATGQVNPAWSYPTRHDDPKGVHLLPQLAKKRPELVDVDPAKVATIASDVRSYLAGVTGEPAAALTNERKLTDLGLDSLAVVDKIQTWVNNEYKRQFSTPESFLTVGDVIAAASGQLSATAGVELRPPSDKYLEQIKATGPATIATDMKSAVQGFLKAVRNDPNRIVTIDERLGEVTNRQLAMYVSLFVPVLEKMPGKTIGVLVPNTVLSTVIALAAPLAGKTPALVNPQWTDDHARAALASVGVESIITADAVIRALKAARDQNDARRIAAGTKTAVEVAMDPSRTNFPSIEEKFVTVDDVLRKMSELRQIAAKLMPNRVLRRLEARAAKIKSDGVATIMFTSGSTAAPKGIALRQEQVVAQATALAKHIKLGRDEVLLHLAPNFHVVGYNAGMMASLAGVPTVNIPDPRAAAIAVKNAQLRKATTVVGTPALINALANAAGENGLATLRRIIVGAGALEPAVEANIRRAAPYAKILQGYGATETGVTFLERVDHVDPSKRTIGTALPGVEYVVVDPDDLTRRVAPGEEGMLLVRTETSISPEHSYVAATGGDEPFATVDGKAYYITEDIVRERTDLVDDEGHMSVQFVDRAGGFSKINDDKVQRAALASVIAKMLPETPDGCDKCTVVESTRADGSKCLVAYAVPGRAADGSPVTADGQPLTYGAINTALLDAFDGKVSHTVTEVRLVPTIEMLGSGKLNLGYYKKAGKEPHDGAVLRAH